MMRAAIVATLIALSVGGCVRYTPHPWSQGFEFDAQSIEYVSSTKLSRVREEQEADAIQRLDQRGFLRLTAKEYTALSQNPVELQENEIPYLIRGVSWSRPPWFSIVAMNREKAILYVTQYTSNFEFAWPGQHWQMRPHPVIAVLDQQIGDALTRAIIGGDRIIAAKMHFGEKAWDEWAD